jgi:hypothetical protein
MRPCVAGRRSATGRDLLASRGIEVGSEPVEIDARRALERCHCFVGANEATATHWGKLADGNTVSGDDEALALVELAHDLTAVVSQLALGDLGCHTTSVARVLHGAR